MTMPKQAENTSGLKNFLPLIIIFLIIILYTAIMQTKYGMWDALFAMRHFEGAFFIIFSIFKMINWPNFVEAYRLYDIVARRSKFYAYLYPLIELALGFAYVFEYQLLFTSMITLILMIIGTIGVMQALRKKQTMPCARLGAVFKLPMTYVTLMEDLLMGVMALVMMWLSW